MTQLMSSGVFQLGLSVSTLVPVLSSCIFKRVHTCAYIIKPNISAAVIDLQNLDILTWVPRGVESPGLLTCGIPLSDAARRFCQLRGAYKNHQRAQPSRGRAHRAPDQLS